MLTTKHNSCLYLSQSFNFSLCLCIHCSKKSVRNKEISGLATGEGIYQTTHDGLYTDNIAYPKKVFLFDLM